MSFLIIGYCSVCLLVLVPNFQFAATWKPDGILRVAMPYPDARVDSGLRADDIISAIDGVSVRRSARTLLFRPGRAEYRYSVIRDGTQLEIVGTIGDMTWSVLRMRLPSMLLAICIWIVGSMIVLFAPLSNGEAWQVGLIALGLATVLATSEASLYGIPYAWLASSPFLPVLSVGYASLGAIGRREQRPILPWLFNFLYLLAFILGILSLYEILWLDPHGLSFERLTGVSLDDILLLLFAVSLGLNPVILGLRYLFTSGKRIRSQIVVLLSGTALAVAPLVFLTILPATFLGESFVPWEGTFLFLLLVPATYGYVILRRNYLELDIYATRVIFSLMFLLVLYGVYAIGVVVVERWGEPEVIQPVAGFAAFVPAAMIAIAAGQFLHRTAVSVIYGRRENYQRILEQITADVSLNPDLETLRQVFHTFLEALEVRQGALFFKQGGKNFELFEAILRDGQRLDKTLLGQSDPIPQKLLIRTTVTEDFADVSRYFAENPWVEAIVPLRSREKAVGIMFLAGPTPDGIYNAQDARFIQQIADSLSIASAASVLFDASLTMTRRLLQIRDMERTLLAAEIHNEPLQWVSVIAGELETHIHQMSQSNPAEANDLARIQKRLLLASDHLRSICAGLRPPVLSQGIQWTVQEAIEQAREEAGYAISLSLGVPPDLLLHDDVTKSIYYVMVEALTNAKKHSQATHVWVDLSIDPESRLHLQIRDDGTGMTATGLSLSEEVFSRHFGIVGMKQWASIAGGLLTILSEQGKGTLIDAYFPLDPLFPLRPKKMSKLNDLVIVNQLYKAYPATNKSAVTDVSFRLRSGRILALLGQNGAGKTTTVKMICGLIRPTSGSVQVLGHDISSSRAKAVARIGAVLEGARNVYWRLTAWDNLYYFGSLRAVPHAELARRIPQWLKMMELEQDQDKEVRFFSRGMQQKLAIAAALIHDPEILLLDEPTLGLDVHSARKIEEVLLHLARQEGKAILLTTHTMSLAEKIADEIFVIHEGRQVAYDSTSRLLAEYHADRESVEIDFEGDASVRVLEEIRELIPSVALLRDNSTTHLKWLPANQGQIVYILELLHQNGLTIANVSRRRPSLEEVFLSLTGKSET